MKRKFTKEIVWAKTHWKNVVWLYGALKKFPQIQRTSTDTLSAMIECDRVSIKEVRKSLVRDRLRRTPLFRKWFPPSSVKGKTVLDFGCGSGVESLLLEPHAKHITGVDVPSGSIRLSSLLLDPSKFDAVQLNYYEDLLRLSPVDVVYAYGVLHHLPVKASEYVASLLATLCKERFVAMVYTAKQRRLYPTNRAYDEKSLTRYVERVMGLEVQRMRRVPSPRGGREYIVVDATPKGKGK